MATTTIKTTYSLDVETVRKLEELARRWQVSKSEALRRAIRAASQMSSPGGEEAAKALDQIQDSLRLKDSEVRQWERTTRLERQSSSKRREQGGR